MDITAVSQPMPVAVTPTAGPAPMAREPLPGSGPQIGGAGVASANFEIEVAARRIIEAAAAAEEAPLPTAGLTRAEIGVDEGSRRIFARLVNRQTGEVVREYPPDELLRLFALSREQFSHLFQADV